MILKGDKALNISDFFNVLFKEQKVEISEEVQDKVKGCYDFLYNFSKDKVIYGINTGLGPMAQYKIDDKSLKELQFNLIRSHSAGSGSPLSEVYVKAAMIARLNTLSQGHSGVHPEVIELLATLINHEIYPFIPEHGGVGASGDLVQLAHLALILIGEGEVFYKGEIESTKEIFESLNIKPIDVHIREGLALINGTSVMTGIGIVNSIYADKLLNWSLLASSIINELVESYDDHFSKELNGVKLHQGQRKIADAMRNVLDSSKLIKKRAADLFDKKVEEEVIEKKVQEYYSIRCVPQILGPIYETIKNTERVLIDEVNSVNDNPIIDVETNNVYHGGNFHGDYISLEMDKLRIVITKLSMLAERQLNYLLNHKLNEMLPPFVNLGTLGLNLGMQGTQFTATSTAAENQMLSNSMYVHSIPNNNDNQDIVSMGTNSALMTKKVIENSFQILSIQYITIMQAIDYLKCSDSLSDKAKEIYNAIREIVPVFADDSIRYKEIANVTEYLTNNQPNII